MQRGGCTGDLFGAVRADGRSRRASANVGKPTQDGLGVKILTAALAARISTALTNTITPHQTGFMRKRLISSNIHTLNLLQAIQKDRLDEEAAFIALDQEKAFDRASWKTLHTAFEAIGFGPNLCKWISTIYSISSPLRRRIRVNGELSEEYLIRCGVPQGDSASPIAFIILMEGLAVPPCWAALRGQNRLP